MQKLDLEAFLMKQKEKINAMLNAATESSAISPAYPENATAGLLKHMSQLVYLNKLSYADVELFRIFIP